jgi:hypothetical protein
MTRRTSRRVPILWFQDTDEHETPRQRFHIDVQVAPGHGCGDEHGGHLAGP